MNKTLVILRYEVFKTVRSKSFLFGAVVLPLIVALVMTGLSILRDDSGGAGSGSGSGSGSDAPEQLVEGYVDPIGLITEIPADIPQERFMPFVDEDSAERALKAGDIAAYYVITADYVAQGDLIYVLPDYHIGMNRGQSWTMGYVIFANLLGNDAERIARAGQPMQVEEKVLPSPTVQRDEENSLTFWIPYAAMLLFTMVMMMSSGLLLDSVGKEKQYRVMELLLMSVNPRQLLTGKIVGLGVLGLVQTLIWGGVALAALRLRGQAVNIPEGFELSGSILAWAVVFFLLGYAVYASLLAGLGALAPNIKDASQSTFVVIWPVMIPMFLVSILSKQPHGALATVLSLFPLTAPSTMLVRLVTGGVPWWQLVLSLTLLALTALFVLRAIANMFHAQHLLSGQPFAVRRYLRVILGRE
jgi:ABC-2 type transport system permease protein